MPLDTQRRAINLDLIVAQITFALELEAGPFPDGACAIADTANDRLCSVDEVIKEEGVSWDAGEDFSHEDVVGWSAAEEAREWGSIQDDGDAGKAVGRHGVKVVPLPGAGVDRVYVLGVEAEVGGDECDIAGCVVCLSCRHSLDGFPFWDKGSRIDRVKENIVTYGP